jgi:tetratricopeptide (TPR) repeat protein
MGDVVANVRYVLFATKRGIRKFSNGGKHPMVYSRQATGPSIAPQEFVDSLARAAEFLEKLLTYDTRRTVQAVFFCFCMLWLARIAVPLPWALAQGGTFRAPIPKPAPRSVQKAPARQPATEGKKPEKEVAIDYEYEMKRLNNLIRLDARNADALYNRACLYEQRGQLEMAEKDYTRVIQIDKRYKDAFFNRGLVYLKTKKYDAAVKDFSEVIKLDPKAADAYCNRGNANLRLGNMDLALQDYDAAIKAKPDDGDLYYNRALLHLARGAKSKAVEDFKKAADKGHPKAREYLQKNR